MRAPESDSAGQGSLVAASDDVEYLLEEWILPNYQSPGLPGTPAWSEAIRTTELTFVAADYKLSLLNNPVATKFEEAIGSDNKQSHNKEDISQERSSLEVDDLKGERTAAPEEDSEEDSASIPTPVDEVGEDYTAASIPTPIEEDSEEVGDAPRIQDNILAALLRWK